MQQYHSYQPPEAAAYPQYYQQLQQQQQFPHHQFQHQQQFHESQPASVGQYGPPAHTNVPPPFPQHNIQQLPAAAVPPVPALHPPGHAQQGWQLGPTVLPTPQPLLLTPHTPVAPTPAPAAPAPPPWQQHVPPGDWQQQQQGVNAHYQVQSGHQHRHTPFQNAQQQWQQQHVPHHPQEQGPSKQWCGPQPAQEACHWQQQQHQQQLQIVVGQQQQQIPCQHHGGQVYVQQPPVALIAAVPQFGQYPVHQQPPQWRPMLHQHTPGQQHEMPPMAQQQQQRQQHPSHQSVQPPPMHTFQQPAASSHQRTHQRQQQLQQSQAAQKQGAVQQHVEQRKQPQQKEEHWQNMQDKIKKQAEAERQQWMDKAATSAAAEHQLQRQKQRQQCLQDNLRHSKLLQLPEGILSRIAAKLSKQQCAMFGLLVLPEGSIAAAEVLGSITSVNFCRKDPCSTKFASKPRGRSSIRTPNPCSTPSTYVLNSLAPQPMRDAPSFLTALHNLRSLSLELCTSGKRKKNKAGFEQGYPGFASLTALPGLTSLQLTMLACYTSAAELQQKALKTVVQLSSLRALGFIGGTAHSPPAGAFAGLSGLTGLQSLRLQYLQCKQDLGLRGLSVLTGLTELDFEEQSNEPGIHMHIVYAKGLYEGFLDLAPVLAAAKLQKLTLRGMNLVCSRGLVVRPDALRVLDITGCAGLLPVSKPEWLRSAPLQHLRLSSCLSLVSGGSGLLSLVRLGEAKCGEAAPAAAAMVSSLTLLDISDQGHIAWGQDILCQLTKLKDLNIAGTHLGRHRPTAAEGPAAAAVGAELDIEVGNIGLCEVLAKSLTGLTSLTMGCSAAEYQYDCVIPLGELLWLTRLAQLQHLAVHGSTFEGSSLEAKASKLATCLLESSGLVQLTLKGCGFEYKDSKAVTKLLRDAGVGVRGLCVQLSATPEPRDDAAGLDSDCYDISDEDYMWGGDMSSDGGYGADWGGNWDYQDDLGGFYPDGPFGEVYYAAER